MTERFTLLSELGRGGMGVVWKARDEETGQIVALKLLREAYAEDPDYLARFERELELARRITSANVVRVLGFGVRKKVPYLALEYVDGPSLHEALAQHGPYSWPETKALLIQLARGLADAHAAEVIHRDVKPSNVLIGTDGTAKLTDFGIARGLDLTRVTATSTMLGTPAYLAPEGPVDNRSDLYSLGIMGFELLAGCTPFVGTTYQQVILAHVRTPPALDKLPSDARPIIGWLLAKDADERPQNAQELIAVLQGRLLLPGAVETVVIAAPAPAATVKPPAPAPAPAKPASPQPSQSAAALGPGPRKAAALALKIRNAGRFGRGASMSIVRTQHCATLLANGRVLITCGWDGKDAIRSAEVFDPVSASVSVSDAGLWARMGHTATLLDSGKVLIAGGCDSATTFASAEQYDPAVRDYASRYDKSFTSTPGMNVPRAYHTATMLLSGKVLIVGGSDRERSVPVAEIETYNPGSGTFTPAGRLITPRWRHISTLLTDGRVLITGGLTTGGFADTAELYDPRTQATASVGRLLKPRRDHAAVVLQDGSVLLAGGMGPFPLDLAEVYVPGRVGFTTLGFAVEPRSHHTATLLPDGRVLLVGGSGPEGPLRSSELFYPDSNSFARDASMTTARAGHTATALADGRILIAGGRGQDEGSLASTEIYSQ